MKKYFLLALVVWTGIASSCKYDDDEVWDSVNNLADRVTALEAVTKQMNSDIAALQSIVSALQKQVAISEVETLADGYILHFTDGTKATIKSGEDGKDGENGKDGQHAPMINVAQEDGVYYWTVTMDGKTEWLTDEDGNKLPVSGEDGEDGSDGATGAAGKDGYTPLLKVNDEGCWEVSYENGEKYVLKDADGNEVKAPLFKEIKEEEEYVFITLAGEETPIKLPRLAEVILTNGNDVQIEGTLQLSKSTGMDPLKYKVTSLGTNYSVEVLKTPEGVEVTPDEDAKELDIHVGNNAQSGEGKIIILFYNANQTITYSLEVEIIE